MRRRDPSFSPVKGKMLIASLNIGKKAKIDVYYHYIYIHRYYISKKVKEKVKNEGNVVICRAKSHLWEDHPNAAEVRARENNEYSARRTD